MCVCECVWGKVCLRTVVEMERWDESYGVTVREGDFRVNFECTSHIFSSGLGESRDRLSTSLSAMTDSTDWLYSPLCVCLCVCVPACKGVRMFTGDACDV